MSRSLRHMPISRRKQSFTKRRKDRISLTVRKGLGPGWGKNTNQRGGKETVHRKKPEKRSMLGHKGRRVCSLACTNWGRSKKSLNLRQEKKGRNSGGVYPQEGTTSLGRENRSPNTREGGKKESQWAVDKCKDLFKQDEKAGQDT